MCEFYPKLWLRDLPILSPLLLLILLPFIKYLFFIVVWPISRIFKAIVKLFAKKAEEEEKIGVDELDEMVNVIEEEGILEEEHAELLRGAIDLSDIEAFEIMTPRVDVYAIDVEDDINELIKDEDFLIYSHSVYKDTIDNIIGILPVKALAKLLVNDTNIDIASLTYKPLMVPEITKF